MTSPATTTPQWRRVLLAAARLAALYAVGVVLLLIPLFFLLGHDPSVPDWSRLLKVTTIPFAILFGTAFVLLVAARRVGFAVLWSLLVGWWAVMLTQTLSIDAPTVFIVWSAFSLPLYFLGALGTREALRSTGSAWRILTSGWLVAIWIGLVLLGFRHSAGWLVPDWAAQLIWLPAPLVIAVLSTVGFWVGTRRSTSPAV